jgi:NDP-sugar pyrophosphorylase family protein
MILAAGVGSRLDPLTIQIPKPLAPVLGKPLMEHIIELCKKHGFTNLVANTHVLADKITEYFSNGSRKHGTVLNLVYEERLSGVAGGIRSCRKYLTQDIVLIIMGDALTDVDLTALYEAHINSNCLVTMGTRKVEDPSLFGVVVTDKNNKVVSFQEKPKPEEAKSNQANTGIYFFNQIILNEIPDVKSAPEYDVAKDLFPKLMSKDVPMQAININAYWADIGTLKQYHQSIKDAFDGKVKINIDAQKAKGCKIKGKVYLGENVKVGPNVTLKGYVYIEDNCIIEDNSYIDDSIIWSNSFVGKNVKLINSILGNNCTVKEGTEIISNSVWAPESIIKNDSKPSVVFM